MRFPCSGGKPVPFPSPTNAETAESRMITGITSNDGVTQTTTKDILHILVEFLRSKYNSILVDVVCVNLVKKAVYKTLPL
jgi:hypothetical protein